MSYSLRVTSNGFARCVNAGFFQVGPIPPPSWVESTTVLRPSTTIGRGMNAVAVSGDKMAISSAQYNYAGAIYTYQWVNSSWVQDGTFPTISDGAHVTDFYGYSIALDGDLMVISSTRDDGNGSDTGIVNTFEFTGGQWVRGSPITPYNSLGAGDNFGFAMSMSGTNLAVSAPFDDGDGNTQSNSGVVYTYNWDGYAWRNNTTNFVLRPSTLGADDTFGSSVAMSGDKLAVGAPEDDGPTNSSSAAGCVYTYRLVNGAWVQDAAVLRPPNAGVRFGTRVSMDGDKLAVSAVSDSTARGAVYTYTWNSVAAEWVQDAAVLRPSTLDAQDYFGQSMQMSGDKLVVGTYQDDGENNATAYSSGCVYTFTHNGTQWIQDSDILRPSELEAGDQFGWAVAVSGTKMAVVAREDDGVGNLINRQGAVYTFEYQ